MYIYKITNLINNKIYIGQTVKKLKYRFSEHKRSSKVEKYKNIILYKAMKKYGKENFKIEEIDKANNVNCLNKKEIYWIKKLNTMNREIGYNMCIGGNNTTGRKHTLETRKTLSEKAKERYKTEKSIRNISVGAFNEEGICVAKFISIVNAAKYCNVSESSIRQKINTKVKIFSYYWKKIDKVEKDEHNNIKRLTKEKNLYKINPITLEIIEKFNSKPSKDLRKKLINNPEYTFENYRWATKGNEINYKLYKYIIKKDNKIIEIPFINNIGKEKILEFFNIKSYKRLTKNIKENKKYKGYEIKIEKYFIKRTF